MSEKYSFVDKANGVRVEEHDHTIKLSVKEAAHLTPIEADEIARALSTAAGRVRVVRSNRIIERGADTLGVFGAVIGAGAVFLALLVQPANAQGACGAIREFDRRQACIAIQDGNSAECASLRDPSDRAVCRMRADNRRGLRDPYSGPTDHSRPLGGNH
jgi:hypothetical protein